MNEKTDKCSDCGKPSEVWFYCKKCIEKRRSLRGRDTV